MSACQSNDNSTTNNTAQNYMKYENSRFNFSVEIPDKWDYNVHGTENYEATATKEAMPTSGISVNVENDHEQVISVYGQIGSLSWDDVANSVVEDFVTKSGLKGMKYTSENQNTISIIYVFDQDQLTEQGYNTRALGASILMSEEAYVQNKDTIEYIIQSIRIT